MEGEQEIAPKLSSGTSLNDFQWPFQGHDFIQRQITQKRYEIELYLQWRTNRKSLCDLSNGAIFNDLEQPLT